MAVPLRGKKIKHVCSVPNCRNTDVLLLSRSRDYAIGERVYICRECATELAELYGIKRRRVASSDVPSQAQDGDDGGAEVNV